MKKNTNTTAQTTATQTTNANQEYTFTDLITAYETAHATGADTTTALYNLATAVALSVLRKCIDPQRKTATERETISNNGINPALVEVKRGIVADLAYLDNLTTAHNTATALQFNKDGDLVQIVTDKSAEKTATALQSVVLSDGLDLVNSAVVAILEQTADHATGGAGWLETPYTTRRICKRVLIQAGDSAKWETVETTPIQEVYRAVRREIQNSRATQTDPRNGYTYIEDTATDPDSTATETIYRRLQKWADLGGYTHSGHYDAHGNANHGTLYTADPQSVADYESVITALNLTDRQAIIVSLRMRGYGYQAIATYMGIRESNVRTILSRLRDKCEKVGFSPAMWAEMTANK